jgi:hypothetical protein
MATPRKTASRTSSAQAPLIFSPTLLPDPFGETSPELCWEWRGVEATFAIRLTQFNWSATGTLTGEAPRYWKADTLDELREEVLDAKLASSMAKILARPWVLAYESAGFTPMNQ